LFTIVKPTVTQHRARDGSVCPFSEHHRKESYTPETLADLGLVRHKYSRITPNLRATC